MIQKKIYTIEKNEPVADRTWRLELSCVPIAGTNPAPGSKGNSDPEIKGSGTISPDIKGNPDPGIKGPETINPGSKAQCPENDFIPDGEFVDIAIGDRFLRRPISICDKGPGSITLYYKTVGEGTRELATYGPGKELDILTGLGHGFDPDACREKALLVGGGLGAAPLFLLCRELRAQGKKVSVILGFNKADEVVLTDEFKQLTPDVTLVTMDGSAGLKGFVTDAIAATNPEFDFFYTCGPMVMMKAVCQALDAPGEASLEERMGCGAGFCYGCSCKTHLGTKRICKDGPVFKKEEIIW